MSGSHELKKHRMVVCRARVTWEDSMLPLPSAIYGSITNVSSPIRLSVAVSRFQR